MLTIVLALIWMVVVVFLVGLVSTKINRKATHTSILVAVSVVVITIGLTTSTYGIFGVREYTDWKAIEEIVLEPFSDETSEIVYVLKDSDGIYSYKSQLDYDSHRINPKEYEMETISGHNVVEIEDKECATPILKVYRRKGIPTIWNMGVGTTEKKYVFYVPEGSIREIEAN